MNEAWRGVIMFGMGFAATWLNARLTLSVVRGSALTAAAICFVLSSGAVVATVIYVNDVRVAPALVVGNCLGTYFSVRAYGRRRGSRRSVSSSTSCTGSSNERT